ncbi:hypothetical protein BDU57DRAFT_515230 [Ampelomyces quisqualis]|uniref:Uncharacterized protein n=1 Tax=Ampelomyces quisqualis TaxID=50730 RepID=A0A6A5QUH5_AMPQU|nr:hypothetical protein BDU57DRAFT_515230 [Ampelomyces quisqualis]
MSIAPSNAIILTFSTVELGSTYPTPSSSNTPLLNPADPSNKQHRPKLPNTSEKSLNTLQYYSTLALEPSNVPPDHHAACSLGHVR